MRTIANDKTSSAVSESGASSSKGKENWFRTHWCMVVLCAIMLLAFLLRFVFAYGPSVSDNFALSGGSTASSHHRIITEILWGTYNPASQVSLNYPYGIESIYGPLFDYCCAAWAKLFSAFGMSYDNAASAALAVNPPIFGALTCIPVFLIAKRFFKDDVVALVAAGFYAIFPILIMTTPFSYGTELPFVCFLMAGLVFFVLSAFDNIDKYGVVGIKGVFTQKPVLLWIALAALFMTFIVYSWTGFWAIVMATSIMLFFALLFDRIGGRDLGAVVGVFIAVITVPVALGAIYYGLIGAWDSVLSGPFTLAVITTVCAVIFLAVQKKPWVFTIPMMLVIIGAVAAVLHFAAPDLASAVYSGNEAYVGTLMNELVTEGSRTSISAMASYYGWITVWCPLFFGVYMAIKYRDNAKSKAYTFVMLWIFAGFFACWFNTEYAVITGAIFAVASAAVIVGVFRYVGLKSYFRSLRGNGVKAGAKKALNFFPLVTILVAVFLIAAPAAVYAADASRPTNDESVSYFGGLGYTINTSDSSLVNSAWSQYKPLQENPGTAATLVTWYGYSDTASSVGGYSTVTSSNGAGTSAMSSVYLSSGSEEAVASLIVRLVENGAAKYTSYFSFYGVADVVELIDSESAARAYMKNDANKDDFVGINNEPTKENLPYLAGVHYLTKNLTEKDVNSLYTDLCSATGKSINYVELDGSMLPIYYGDGSYANYIGYFGDYVMGGSYGTTPAALYSVTSTTYYYYQYGYYDQLYYTYNDAMYSTFLWNALIGVNPSEYGYSSSLELLSNLAKSDGTVKASPLSGIDNFEIAYWHVNYQAEGSSTWKEMDINEALALQDANGGYINYLSSVIILEYACSTNYDTSYVHGGTDYDYSGIRVAVYEELQAGDMGYDPSGKVSNYVQRSTTFVDKDTGMFKVAVPTSGNYLVKFYVGATTLYNGSLIHTDSAVNPYDLPIIATQTGTLVDSNGKAIENSGAYIQFTSSGKVSRSVPVANDGTFSISNLGPDTYTVTVYSAADVSLNTVTVTLSDATGAAIDGLTIAAGTHTIVISVTNMYGDVLSGDVDVTLIDSMGNTQVVTVTDGSREVAVIPGTYTVFIDETDYVSTARGSVTTSSSSSTKASLIAYEATEILGVEPGTVVMALGYSKVATGTSVNVPSTIADSVTTYKVNADKTKVTVNGTELDAVKVVRTLKNGSSSVSGTITYLGSAGEVYSFVSATDGKVTAYIPAGTYTVYATDGSGLSYVAKDVSIASGDAEADYSLSSAYALSFYVKYNTNMSTSTNSIYYVPASFTLGSGEVITAVTDTSGMVKLYLPAESTVNVKVASAVFLGSAFALTEDYANTLTMSSAKPDTFTIKAKNESGVKWYVEPVTVKVNTGISSAIKFKFDGSDDFEKEITDGDLMYDVVPGKYTVTVVDNNGYYIDTTVNIYPNGNSTLFPAVIDLTAVHAIETVTVNKVTATDVVTVVTLTESATSEVITKDNVYYLPTDGEYYFIIKDSKGEKIVRPEIVAGVIENYVLVDAFTLSGYVGTKVTGTIIATDSNSNKYSITVSDGEYSVALPKDTVINAMVIDATATPDNSEYKYSVSGDLLNGASITVDDDTVRNFIQVSTRDFVVGETVKKVEITGTMANGVGNLSVKVTRAYTAGESPEDVTYVITSGSAFELTQSYLVRFTGGATEVTVPVVGHYNDKAVGAGNTNAALTVSTLDGTSLMTKVIPAELYGVEHDATFDGTVHSTMDGFSYRYGIGIINDSGSAQYLKIKSVNYAGSDYKVAIVDSDGYYVTAIDSEEYLVSGYGTTSLYIVFVKSNDDVTVDVPASITVVYELRDAAGTESKVVERQSATVTVDSASVSGGDADNSEVTVSKGFWIVTVFTILLLLLLVWGGMKRGVFTRRK